MSAFLVSMALVAGSYRSINLHTSRNYLLLSDISFLIDSFLLFISEVSFEADVMQVAGVQWDS